jgi:hypothetical protein
MTHAAGHNKATDHGISGSYSFDIGRHLRRHPRNLMTQDARQRKVDLALDDVEVGMADATSGYVHQNLTRFGLRCGDVFDDEVPTDLRQN